MKMPKSVCAVVSCLFLFACGPQPTAVEKAPVAKSAEVSAVSPASQTTEPATACLLKLGYEAWEPYQYTNLDNTAAGLDIELLQAVMDKMGCTLQTRQGSWTELVAAVKSGELDLLPGASQTEARRAFAHFSMPYRTEQFTLFVRSAESAAYPQTTLTDFVLAGHKVGIISDYFYGEEFAELSAQDAVKANIVEASLAELNLARLLDDDIDGMLEDGFVARSMLRRKGLDQQIGAHSINLASSDVFVMFSKATVSAERVEAFNQALKQIQADGSYQRIVARYQQ